MKVALYGRTPRPEWLPKIAEIIVNINKRGACVACHAQLYAGLQAQFGQQFPYVDVFGPDVPLPSDTRLCVSLGGDGTFLEALVWVRDSEIPVAGVNFGHLGFLTGAGTEHLEAWVADLLEGRYRCASHTILQAVLPESLQARVSEAFYPYALNEISIQRTDPSMMEIDVTIDGQALPPYHADGLIVATPTGSTAYNLSVGGPIAFPGAGVVLLSPIAPHNLNVRTLVIKDTAILEIAVRTRNAGAVLNFDNRSIPLPADTAFVLKKAPYVMHSLNFGDNTFIGTLSQKLLWGFDKRNVYER